MKILAIETATEACSAALLIDDKVYSRFQLAPREHTKLVLPMLDEVIHEAGIALKDVDAIAFSRGPGAFTGLRIAAGVAQGIALSIDKPVVPVSTLKALAFQAIEAGMENNQSIVAALDARMGEIYWAEYQYQSGDLVLNSEEKVTKPQVMLESISQTDQITATGTGWDAYYEILFPNGIPERIRYIKDQLPTAEAIAKLAAPMFNSGMEVPAEQAQPVYIRNKVAEKKSV